MNLLIDVVEVLFLRLANVELQDIIQKLLTFGRQIVRLLVLRGLFQVAVKVLLQGLLLAAQGGVPVVLDGVVRAAQEDIGDLGPPVFHSLMKDVENPIFFDAPACFFEQGIELIVPTLSALLACAAGHFDCHLLPLVGSDVGDHLQQLHVLLFVPGALL